MKLEHHLCSFAVFFSHFLRFRAREYIFVGFFIQNSTFDSIHHVRKSTNVLFVRFLFSFAAFFSISTFTPFFILFCVISIKLSIQHLQHIHQIVDTHTHIEVLFQTQSIAKKMFSQCTLVSVCFA